MRKYEALGPILSVALQLTAGCDLPLVLEPDDPPASPPDAAPGPAPDAGSGDPLLPPPETFPDAPVVTTPGDAPAPPPSGVDEGVRIVFPPPVGITTARHVSMRGVARLPGGVTAVRVNGVDALLSPPNAEGAVAWRVDVAPARGRNDIVVSSTDGDGDTIAEAARGALEFAPYMMFQPQALDIDVGHDRLWVSDPGIGGIVAFDLETGAPARVDLAPSADISVVSHAMSIDAAAGRGVALFYQSRCSEDAGEPIHETRSIDLQAGTVALEERSTSVRNCQDELLYGPAFHDSHVVLDAERERFFVAHHECTDDSNHDCTAYIRERRLGGGDPPTTNMQICSGDACKIIDLLVDRRDDRAGFGLLALVSLDDPYDPEFKVVAIDPAAGTQTLIATIRRDLSGDRFHPLTMALDPAGNRLLLLAAAGDGRKSVIEIDLADGAQSLRLVDTGAALSELDPPWATMDSVYDPRRNRLIFAGSLRGGLHAVDLDTGVLTRVLHPSIGEGPTLWCDDECQISTVDDRRQRFFVLASREPRFFSIGFDIYEVDLLTGRRRLVSEYDPQADFFLGPRLLADHPEDRLLVIQYDGEDAGVYTVDIATGERAYLGDTVLPAFRSSASAWDPDRNRLLYADWHGDFALHAYDMDTLANTIVSSENVGSGPSLEPLGDPLSPYRRQDVALDASGTRAFVSQVYERSLISVDLATGDRTAHAMAEPGGPSTWPNAVLVDALRNRFLIGNYPNSSVAAIDLSTGARSVFIDVPPNRRDASVTELIPDHRNERALLVDDARNVLMVDLQTGEVVLLLYGSP